MKTVKIAVGALAGLIAIVAVIAYFLLGNLDNIIKGVIEDVGSEVREKIGLDVKDGEEASGLKSLFKRGD